MMTDKSDNDPVVEQYRRDEKIMVLVFAQWCINHDLDPEMLYKQAYPDQLNNAALKEALDQTVTKQESDHIDNDTILNGLQLFGNDDLAMVVQQEIDKRNRHKSDG